MPVFGGVHELSLLLTFLYIFGVALWLHLNNQVGYILINISIPKKVVFKVFWE